MSLILAKILVLALIARSLINQIECRTHRTVALPLLLPGPQQARSCCWRTPRWRTTRPWWLLVGQLSLSEKYYPWLLRRRVETSKRIPMTVLMMTLGTAAGCCTITSPHVGNQTLLRSQRIENCAWKFVSLAPLSSSKRKFREFGFVNIPLMMRQNITLFSYISRQEPHWHYLSFPSAPGVARLAEDV